MEELFKKRLPEDVVEYSLYLVDKTIHKKDADMLLVEYLNKCLALVFKETSGYIWQNESFNLRVVEDSQLTHLHGSTCFDDSIDDEWLIVHLLLKITEEYPMLVASVKDTDGQFILIEAADYLPKWLNPDTSNNRVFLSRGTVHILLKPSSPGHIPYFPIAEPTLEQALSIVASFPSETEVFPLIKESIESKTKSIPQKLSEHIQYSNVFIPEKLVYILDQYPNFISKCVKAFYLRDPIDLKACRVFHFMKPDTRVWCQIPMSRHQYAQLMQQHFIPDKRSGYQKKSNLPPLEDKGVDLGLKIAHGCEMLCSQHQGFQSKFNETKVFNESRFLRFIEALKDSGYFRGEIEGSKLYQQLYNEAKQYYMKSLETSLSYENVGDFSLQKIFQIINFSLNSDSPVALERLSISATVSDLPVESSDKWMYLDEKEIQKLADKMNKGFTSLSSSRGGINSKVYEASMVNENNNQLKQTVEKINDFVNDISDYTGVETDDKSTINFDPSEFLTSLEELLNVSSSKCNTFDSSDSDEFLSSDSDLDVCENDEKDRVNELFEYMQTMDNELAQTSVGKSFTKTTDDNGFLKTTKCDNANSSKVDVDANMLENFMIASKEEKSTSGPVSNLLRGVGAHLPS